MVFVCTAGEEKKRVRRKFGGQRDAGKKNAGSGTRKGQSVQLVKLVDTASYEKVGPVRFEVYIGS